MDSSWPPSEEAAPGSSLSAPLTGPLGATQPLLPSLQAHLGILLHMQLPSELGALQAREERKTRDFPIKEMKQAIKIRLCNSTSKPKGNFQTLGCFRPYTSKQPVK